jgi:hypothetical protein
MKWLVRDCLELETVGIQGDETEGAGQESLIWWVCARLKSAKTFVIVWSKGVEILEATAVLGTGSKMEHVECSVTSRNVPTGDNGDWKLPFLDRGRFLAD